MYGLIDIKPTAGAHEQIQWWRRQHEKSGSLLNVRSLNTAVLHKALCPAHFGDTEWREGRKNWSSLGNRRKILSTDRAELLRAAEVTAMHVSFCKSCKP